MDAVRSTHNACAARPRGHSVQVSFLGMMQAIAVCIILVVWCVSCLRANLTTITVPGDLGKIQNQTLSTTHVILGNSEVQDFEAIFDLQASCENLNTDSNARPALLVLFRRFHVPAYGETCPTVALRIETVSGKPPLEVNKCLWIPRDISNATKIRVYRASVRSVLLYGSECLALSVKDERRLEVFDHRCLRTILRVKCTHCVSNETFRTRGDNIARISQAIRERRLRCFGHVLCRLPHELSSTALDPAPLPTWRHRRGGQIRTRLDAVRQDMEAVLGASLFGIRCWRKEWIELSRSAAANRHAWRAPIRDLIEAG
ncbi:unnamed protein product [Schistocephalus solidus]|uniref:Envelope glycoprotein L n=1 Tax=Schistocephalus solidus TaxID=70667 RepID=A0A183TF54_SCHSO|nr:unnamed protein product [Schistocephalus solidus]